MTRIRWTQDERDLVCERMAELIREKPGIKHRELFEKGCDILDGSRKRTYTTPSNDKALFDEAYKRAKVGSGKPAPEPERVVEHVYVPVPTPLALDTVPDHELLASAILRLVRLMKPEAVQVMVKSVAPAVAPPLLPPVEPKEFQARLPRVGVVGLLKDQFNHLKGRVNGKRLELVYIDKDLAHNSMPTHLDFVLVQRHTAHRHWNEARDAFGTDRVAFVDGGITQCAEKLKERFDGCLN